MLADDRSKIGPSDPVKVKMGYQIAGLGVHGELLDNADYARANLTILKYELATAYAPLIAQLSGANVDGAHLLALTADWRNAPTEARAVAISDGLNGQQAQAASEAAAEAVQRDLEAYLGPDAFATFQSYGKGQYLASQVQQLLGNSSNGLTTAQFVNLAALIGNSDDERGILEQSVTPEILAAAAGFLSPDQLRALQTFSTTREQ